MAAVPQQSVFINCPYDVAYTASLQAIMLGAVCCGFTPRSAIESGEAAKLRLPRIVDALFTSHFSIHDLSRCKGEGDLNLARFNMPLELGMALARKHDEPPTHRDLLVLVPAGSDYVRYISDLAGIDPREHDGIPETILKRVMAWLASYAAGAIPSPRAVAAELPRFNQKWNDSVAEWGEPRWWTLVDCAREIYAQIPQ